MKEVSAKRLNAKVVLCRCPDAQDKSVPYRLFGIRIEEQNGDWVRTWAFKIDEDKAKREKFGVEMSRGTMNPTADYPGCPYCGTTNLAQCSCGKVFCWDGESRIITCPWCGQAGEYEKTEKIDIQGGGL